MNKGTYILFIRLRDEINFKTSNKNFNLKAGNYVYVGSAMKNLYQRVGRHISYKEGNYKKHWHIDNLLEQGIIERVFLIPDGKYKEINLSKMFNEDFEAIKGFGASDIKELESNLYFINNINKAYDLLKKIK
ncbi:MAG: GIY-YIG nuclease family protein [Thermotogota bacterium]